MRRHEAENFLIETLSEAQAADALEHFERENLLPPAAFSVSDEQLRMMGVIDPATRGRILVAFARARHEGRRQAAQPAPAVSMGFAPSPHGPGPAMGPTMPPGVVNVVVRDIEMSFGSMVTFMVKWALACIPAMLILTFIGFVVSAMFGAMLASCADALL